MTEQDNSGIDPDVMAALQAVEAEQNGGQQPEAQQGAESPGEGQETPESGATATEGVDLSSPEMVQFMQAHLKGMGYHVMDPEKVQAPAAAMIVDGIPAPDNWNEMTPEQQIAHLGKVSGEAAAEAKFNQMLESAMAPQKMQALSTQLATESGVPEIGNDMNGLLSQIGPDSINAYATHPGFKQLVDLAAQGLASKRRGSILAAGSKPLPSAEGVGGPRPKVGASSDDTSEAEKMIAAFEKSGVPAGTLKPEDFQ